MKLYYTPGACSLAVRIALNETGVPYQEEQVDLKTKKTATGKDYLTINPKGYVPALATDNGHIFTENAAIQQYLADTFKDAKLLPPIGDKKRYEALEWLTFVTTELHKGLSPFFNPEIPADVKEKTLKPTIKKKLTFVDNHLADNLFLLGDHYTLADGYLFVICTWLSHFNIDIAQWPHLEKYFNNLKQRNSIKKALEQEQSNKN